LKGVRPEGVYRTHFFKQLVRNLKSKYANYRTNHTPNTTKSKEAKVLVGWSKTTRIEVARGAPDNARHVKIHAFKDLSVAVGAERF